MKKIISVILLIVMLVFLSITANALNSSDRYEELLLSMGYTEEDSAKLTTITCLSDVRVYGLVYQKFEELCDWELVREYYKVDKDEYDKLYKSILSAKLLIKEIPEEIRLEMKNIGWMPEDINEFSNKVRTYKLDYEQTWELIKNGKELDSIVKEKRELQKTLSEIANEFVTEEINENEYKEKIAHITNYDMSEIQPELNKLIVKRKDFQQRNIMRSGLTPEEIELCKNNGITKVMDMCRIKYLSNTQKMSFEEFVVQETNDRSLVNHQTSETKIGAEEK